jgi:metallo-beta-lactamase class B
MRMNTGVPLINNPTYPGVVADFARGFKTLKALPVDVFLVSHGGMFDLPRRLAAMARGEPNPFIDPEGFRLYVAEYEAAFLNQLKIERAGGPPNPIPPPQLGPCPEDGRACYSQSGLLPPR